MSVRIYLDTNVFIALIEGNDELSAVIGRLFVKLKDQPESLVTSELTLTELLVKPLRAERGRSSSDWPAPPWTPAQLTAAYRGLVQPGNGYAVIPVSTSVLEMAALLRADVASLKLPDALHLATAVERECTHVLSGDGRVAEAAALFGLAAVPLAADAIELLAEELS
jgi:predicted nucleic acid-binding protein